MFYSQCFLSKKGPLAAIWVAGYCIKRLKKGQVNDTHIPSSVDKILLEGLDSVTYRVLAYLLLGVVRIYSKKVEYLFQDCYETVSDINKLSAGKKVIPFREIVRSCSSILLPQRYELDTFQLEVADVADSYTARSEDIELQDAREDVPRLCFLDKDVPNNEISPHLEENSNAQTSSGISRQQGASSSYQTPDKVTADRETSANNAYTPPDMVLSTHRMEVDTVVISHDHIETLQPSKEKLRDLRFNQDECMDVDMICGLDVELLNLVNEYQEQNGDDVDRANLEKAPLEEHDRVMLEENEMPSTVEKTPSLEVPDTAGASIPPLLALPTPAKENIIRRTHKRKCIIDETLVLDNQVMKHTINDASDVVCKRRKAPHTVMDIWRFLHIPVLAKHNFSEPFIRCAAQYNFRSEKIEKAKPSSSTTAAETMVVDAVSKPHDIVSPMAIIAPGTPVPCQSSARVFASPTRVADSDGENPENLFESARKEQAHENEEDHSPILLDEVDSNGGDSEELQKNKYGMSTRTRTVAKHLHKVIHKKKQQGQESVSLLPIIERGTKAENARYFFEILVLASGGFVKVNQEKAYDDVIIEETPKIEEALSD